jgi:hypothetical protein
MKLTEKDKEFIALKERLEGKQCHDTLMSVVRMMVIAQDAIKDEYGLAGIDMPLFNELPLAERDGEKLAREALGYEWK